MSLFSFFRKWFGEEEGEGVSADSWERLKLLSQTPGKEEKLGEAVAEAFVDLDAELKRDVLEGEIVYYSPGSSLRDTLLEKAELLSSFSSHLGEEKSASLAVLVSALRGEEFETEVHRTPGFIFWLTLAHFLSGDFSELTAEGPVVSTSFGSADLSHTVCTLLLLYLGGFAGLSPEAVGKLCGEVEGFARLVEDASESESVDPLYLRFLRFFAGLSAGKRSQWKEMEIWFSRYDRGPALDRGVEARMECDRRLMEAKRVLAEADEKKFGTCARRLGEAVSLAESVAFSERANLTLPSVLLVDAERFVNAVEAKVWLGELSRNYTKSGGGIRAFGDPRSFEELREAAERASRLLRRAGLKSDYVSRVLAKTKAVLDGEGDGGSGG